LKKSFFFLCFLILFLFIPFVSAHTITVPTNFYFGIPRYGTYINFNTEKTFDNVYRENDYWYFDGYGFQVQNANMTITDYFTNPYILKLTVNAPSGTASTTKVYVGDKGVPKEVWIENGTLAWSYDASTTTLTLEATHLNRTVKIVVDWRMPGDVNGDGAVDMNDLTRVAEAYGSTSREPLWNEDTDLNRDNLIDILELFTVGKNYGNREP